METICSFDVFDTLIARRCVTPERIHDGVESRSAVPGLAHARRQADSVLHGMQRGYDLLCIYVLACRLLGLPVERAEALAALEFEIELENVIPITHNLQRVRGDDLLISDMYLSEAQIRALLARAGAPLRNTLLVSNHGKSSGRVWAALQGRVAISQHYGDNVHSDHVMPARSGFAGTVVGQHLPSVTEQRCTELGLHELAQTMRSTRLADGHAGEGTVLWQAACQLNFPLLVMASAALEAVAVGVGVNKGFERRVFFARDGNLWIDVHRRLFPERDSAYLYCSRQALLSGDSEFDRYFDAVSGSAALHVDLYSTGSSFSSYLARRQRRGHLFVICHADDTSYRHTTEAERASLELHASMRRSALLAPRAQLGLGLEMANFALHRRVRGVLAMPGGHVPVFVAEREYDEHKVAVQHAAVHACLQAFDARRCLQELAAVDTRPLMQWLYTEISGHQALVRCFPEHHAADTQYLISLARAQRQPALAA